ncbi:MAG: 50S ribosomal protein L11 [Candidatus Micrarchaeota archaeon]|nr:50S ribosomal protein L11 [Candidatus Micrarchaeota archaeon]
MAEAQVKAIVEGGKASGGPPLGPSLGPLGVNINEVINEINRLTADFKGVKVPVTVYVNKETKKFRIEIGTPPVSELLKKEAAIEKGRKEKGQVAGNLTIDQIIKVAKMKQSSSNSTNIKDIVKSVVGTCVSIGLTVEGKNPKDIIKEIDEGKYDAKLSKT